MGAKKKVNKILARNLIISSVVWASVILFYGFDTNNSNKGMTMVLLSAFYIEFLRITSYNKSIKKEVKENKNVK